MRLIDAGVVVAERSMQHLSGLLAGKRRGTRSCSVERPNSWRFCQAFSEPGAGSDLASLRTRATPIDGGFVLSGQKVWTSHAADADQCLVLARTAPPETVGRSHCCLSLFLVPLGLSGVTVAPIRQPNGDMEFSELFFDDVALPNSALLGPSDDGWRAAISALAHERAASMMLTLRTRSMVRDTFKGGGIAVPASRRNDVLKPYTELAFDLHGSAATVGAVPKVADALLFSRASTIAAGTTEVMRNILAEQVLGLPR